MTSIQSSVESTDDDDDPLSLSPLLCPRTTQSVNQVSIVRSTPKMNRTLRYSRGTLDERRPSLLDDTVRSFSLDERWLTRRWSHGVEYNVLSSRSAALRGDEA
jgi:hypothetical protein